MADLQSRFVRNPRAQVRVTSEKAIPDVAVPGTSATWGYEQTLAGTLMKVCASTLAARPLCRLHRRRIGLR